MPVPIKSEIARRKTADSGAVERIDNQSDDRQIEKSEHQQAWNGSQREVGTVWRSPKAPFLLQLFREERRPTTSTSMQSEMAAPSGQL